MTFIPMLTVALVVGESLAWRIDRQRWRSRFFPIALTPKPTIRDPLGKIEAKTVYHGITLISDRAHAKTGAQRSAIWEKYLQMRLSWRFPMKTRESRQNSRLTTDLGKFDWKRFIMAITLFSDGAHAKTGDRVWGNSNGKPFILAISPKKAAVTPKPATLDRLGKIPAETVYHGDCETMRNGETLLQPPPSPFPRKSGDPRCILRLLPIAYGWTSSPKPLRFGSEALNLSFPRVHNRFGIGDMSTVSSNSDQGPRIEHDLLGERETPNSVYWGIHTLRAIENFPITGIPISTYPDFINALAAVKEAAARANHELGKLSAPHMNAIVAACREIQGGSLHDQFVVDVIQGGAGTSTNMNANEVIANRALELMGHNRGDYARLHPLEHVNLSQSTNDVYPTAIKVGLLFAIRGLGAALAELRQAFQSKAAEFRDLIKLGRTQLQDAVPMTLGQEFSAYAVMIEEDEERLREASALVREINLGATAIGTKITSPPGYAPLVCDHLSQIIGIRLVTAPNLARLPPMWSSNSPRASTRWASALNG